MVVLIHFFSFHFNFCDSNDSFLDIFLGTFFLSFLILQVLKDYMFGEYFLGYFFVDAFLRFLGFCQCMVDFFVSLSLNQFLLEFVWKKVWLSNFFPILIYMSMSFSCTLSSLNHLFLSHTSFN